MKYVPCKSECTTDGTRCDGCGRCREEINGSLALVNSMVEFMTRMEYDNPEEFLESMKTKTLKRYNRRIAAEKVQQA